MWDVAFFTMTMVAITAAPAANKATSNTDRTAFIALVDRASNHIATTTTSTTSAGDGAVIAVGLGSASTVIGSIPRGLVTECGFRLHHRSHHNRRCTTTDHYLHRTQ